MITTTFKQLKELNACQERYVHLRQSLPLYGEDTPITLRQVFYICGWEDAHWLLNRSNRYNKLSREGLERCADIINNWERAKESLR